MNAAAGDGAARSMQPWLADVVRRYRFLERYPYHAAVLARLVPVEDQRVPAMAVSCAGDRFRLHINPRYFEEHPGSEVAVLLHEIQHIEQGHLGDESLRGVDHPDLMQLAMEVAANDLVRDRLPGTPVQTDAFERFGVRSRQATPEIYARLVAARERGERIPRLRSHACGRVLVTAEEPDDLDIEALAERLGPQEALRVLRASHSGGHAGLPHARMTRTIRDDGRAPISLDWRSALRLLLPRTRSKRYTYRYPSRRAPGRLGEIPGRQRLTSRSQPFKVMAAIDTSASMSPAELAEIARQMSVLDRLARVTVVECNRAIQRVYPFRKRLTDVHGGGGTSYMPVFERAFLRAHRPDVLIYFTDGECRYYPKSPPPVPTLWVLTSGRRFGCPWGKQARLA